MQRTFKELTSKCWVRNHRVPKREKYMIWSLGCPRCCCHNCYRIIFWHCHVTAISPCVSMVFYSNFNLSHGSWSMVVTKLLDSWILGIIKLAVMNGVSIVRLSSGSHLLNISYLHRHLIENTSFNISMKYLVFEILFNTCNRTDRIHDTWFKASFSIWMKSIALNATNSLYQLDLVLYYKISDSKLSCGKLVWLGGLLHKPSLIN